VDVSAAKPNQLVLFACFKEQNIDFDLNPPAVFLSPPKPGGN
jgi:hypothetical protein